MTDITKGFKILTTTIARGENGYHQDYARTVHLADTYKKLITGENIASLLIQFTPRESKEQFKQRLRLTQSVTPAMSEKIINPFYKVSRIDNVNKQLVWKSENPERTQLLHKTIESFYGDETLDDFMESRFTQLSFTDANAFLVVEFDDFNAKTQNAKPYPMEVSSREAINYKYKNNILQWLIVKLPITYKSTNEGGKVTKRDGYQYRIYLPNQIIVLNQVDSKLKGREAHDIDITEIEEETKVRINNQTFVVRVAHPLAGEVQAIRIGYKRDTETEGRTYVNPFHPALSRFMKSIKAVSEFDITTTAHVFPQKLQYVEACRGTEKSTCNQGNDINGKKCESCGGSGIILHKTASDSITLPLPKRKEEMMELDKLLVYKTPPVDLIKFQKEYSDDLEQKSLTDVFVSESLARITGTMTATEKVVDMESVYDTLLPYANKYSTVWKKMVRLSATFTDTDKGGLIVRHNFPKDFKMKTVNALLNDLTEAKNSDAPEFLKTEIAQDIAVKIYANNPEALKKYKVKQQHIPFKGKSPMEIQLVMNSELTPKDDKILYSNFESIITELEKEHIADQKNFFDLPFDKREEAIDKKVKDYRVRIKQEELDDTASTMFGGDTGEGVAPEDIATPVDIEAEAKAKLKGTVGGITAIIGINSAVARGEMTEESAKELLVQIFGFTSDIADILIDKPEPATT